MRGDLMVLQLIKDNLGVRPLYVARTSGGYVSALGLDTYALMQGLAVKIMPTPVVASADTVPVQGAGHIDVTRTRALWKTYEAPPSIIRRGDWVDRPSVGIPYVYIVTASVLAQVLDARGEKADSEKLRLDAIHLATAARALDIFGPSPPEPPAASGSDARVGVPVKR